MATETAPTTNGVYNGYQGQDSSSVASGPNHTATTSQSTTSSAQTAKPDALEIGWFFVEQYYTTLSKNPEKIHLFYSKKSQLVTGKEAEKVVPCVGQKAISDKIKDLEFKDCKVRVLNVDSQASFQNIVVQVIGEISNNAQPHSKFVQTFVLAEQPNGYFVLNDIFRHIDIGEDDEITEDEPVEEPAPAPEAAVQPSLEANKSAESVADEAGAQQLDAKLEEIEHEEEKAIPTVEANGADEEDDEEEAPTEEPELAKAEEAAAVATPKVENPPEPEPSRLPTPPPKESAPAPVTEAAPVKSWAHLVRASAGTTPVTPVQPQAPAATPKAAPQPATAAPTTANPTTTEPSTSQTASQGNGWQTADHSKKQSRAQKTDQAVSAYVKNVTEKVDARVLRNTLESFGELKYFDVSRPKNCAFVEFATAEGYAAAAAANPHVISGESVLVEERRRPGFGNAPSGGSYARGGSTTSRGRGGFQGRSGSQSGTFPKDAGRGGFQGRGGSKGGNVTPKGRGQTQAA